MVSSQFQVFLSHFHCTVGKTLDFPNLKINASKLLFIFLAFFCFCFCFCFVCLFVFKLVGDSCIWKDSQWYVCAPKTRNADPFMNCPRLNAVKGVKLVADGGSGQGDHTGGYCS